MRRTFCGIPVLGFVLLSSALAAFAQTEQTTEALRHYELGLKHVQNKAHGEAIAEFNQAYELGHDFAVLYDIGLSYLAIDEPARAVTVLERYLSEGGKYVPNSRRKEVEEEIAKQQDRIATVVIRSKFDGAVIKIDGVEVGKTPIKDDLKVNVGAHLITATAPGYRPWEHRLEMAGGDRRNLEVALEPEPQAAGPATGAAAGPSSAELAAAQAAPVRSPVPTRRVAAYVAAGVGLGAIVVGSVFGVRALSKRNDSDAECPANHCSQAGVDLNNQAKTAARVADITLGVGVVSLVAATYLLITSRRSEAAAPAASPATSPPAASPPAAPTPTALGIRLLADVGPGQAGLLLRGAW